MKLTFAFIVGVALLAFSFTINAEQKKAIQFVELEDDSKILGEWKLFAEAIALHKEKVELFSIWDFTKKGIIHTRSEDRFGRTKTIKIDLKYMVEDGVIKKQTTPGRSKMESCKLATLNKKEMTLKCTYVYLFFKR